MIHVSMTSPSWADRGSRSTNVAETMASLPMAMPVGLRIEPQQPGLAERGCRHPARGAASRASFRFVIPHILTVKSDKSHRPADRCGVAAWCGRYNGLSWAASRPRTIAERRERFERLAMPAVNAFVSAGDEADQQPRGRPGPGAGHLRTWVQGLRLVPAGHELRGVDDHHRTQRLLQPVRQGQAPPAAGPTTRPANTTTGTSTPPPNTPPRA